MTATANIENLGHELEMFHGSDRFFRTSSFTKRYSHTEGINYLAKNAGCYWLLDIVTSTYHLLREESFQLWKVEKQGEGVKVICEDGRDNILYEQDVEYSDFPLDSFSFYCELGSLNGIDLQFIIMLKGER